MRLFEPQPALDTQAPAVAPRGLVLPARADGVLRLQRAVGNRATGRLLQRNGHDHWALAVTNDRRDTIDAKKRPWERWVLVKGKLEKAGSTLHHVISKTTIDLIVDELDVALESSDRTLATAAKKFEKSLEEAITEGDLREGTTRKKQAWNLPFNLIAGPNDPSEDPGERFDAGYEMSTAPDGSRTFTETELTGHLRALEDAFREGRRKTGVGHGLTAAAWDAMTTAFEEARDLGGDVAIDVNEEEWMNFIPAVGGDKVWIRAGERRYPGVTLGRGLFPRAAVACPAMNAVITARTVSFPLARSEDGDIGSSRAYLSVYIPGQTIKHIWERHTYAGFTMAADDMKAVNTFFRDRTLAIADIQRMVNQSLDAIVDAIRGFIEDAAVGVEDIRLFSEDLDIDLTRVDSPAGRLYVKGNFEHFTQQYIERNLLANMTVLPDPVGRRRRSRSPPSRWSRSRRAPAPGATRTAARPDSAQRPKPAPRPRPSPPPRPPPPSPSRSRSRRTAGG